MFEKITALFRKEQPKTKTVYIISAILIMCAFAVSAGVRYDELKTWKEHSSVFYAGDTPMMTTLDAYKFLRHAKEYKEGSFDTSRKDKMIFYPDDSPFPDPVPLLSVVISFVSDKTGLDLHSTATYIIPIISSIFIIPLGLYFIFLGLPALGILGGAVTTFAPMFFLRTSMGRLDTDGGNFFFIFTASLFTLLAMKASSRVKMFIFSGLLGLTMMLFYTWYHHGMFNLFYLATLVICLAIMKFKIKDIVIASIIYIICTNPMYTFNAFSQLAHAINIYIFNVKEGAAAIFPNVYNTIGEAQKDSFLEVLRSIASNPAIAMAGIFGCILLVAGYFSYMIPLVPLAALGAMAFISAGRFSMFLAPIVGAGLAYLCVFLLSFIKFHTEKKTKIFMTTTPFIAVILIAYGINATGNSAIGIILSPSISVPTFSVFKDIKNELPKNSAIYTWWDYGLAIAETSGFPVFHSGMTQETPKTWVIAKSFISNEQTLYNTISYLDNYGVAEIEYMATDNATLEEIEKHIDSFNEGPSNNADYVMITEDMVVKFSAIAYLATWREGKEPEPKIVFQKLICEQKGIYTLLCGENKFDLQLGLINGNLPIKQLMTLNNSGHITDEIKYQFSQGYYVLGTNKLSKGKVELYLLNQTAYDSSFVQLYFLNRATPGLFELTLDKYPYARIFKVLKKNTAETE